MKLSIVIPCYNEAKNIPLLLEAFKKQITNHDLEIILVNNGSTDQTEAVLNELLPRYHFARTVRVLVNQGYGYGILQGLAVAQGDFLGWTHADLQTDPADILKAYALIEQKKSSPSLFIKGTRKRRPLLDQLFTIGMSFFELLYLRSWLWDINGQPNIFHRSFYITWHNPPHDFALDLYAFYTAKKLGLDLVLFNVIFPQRLHGTSSWNTGLRARMKLIKRTILFSRILKKGLNQ